MTWDLPGEYPCPSWQPDHEGIPHVNEACWHAIEQELGRHLIRVYDLEEEVDPRGCDDGVRVSPRGRG